MTSKTARPLLKISKKSQRTLRPEGGTLVGVWDERWSVMRYEFDLGDKTNSVLGAWLLENNLYSSGNDFTSEEARDPNHVGTSTLRKIWMGKESALDPKFASGRVWVLMNKGKPEGVLAFFYPQHKDLTEVFYKQPSHPNDKPKWQVPVHRLGHLMAFIRPQHRQQGRLGRLLREYALPQITDQANDVRQRGALPLLGATDAMESILPRLTSIPLTPYMSYCLAMKQAVWRMIDYKAMRPEIIRDTDRYLVAPTPCLPKTNHKKGAKPA